MASGLAVNVRFVEDAGGECPAPVDSGRLPCSGARGGGGQEQGLFAAAFARTGRGGRVLAGATGAAGTLLIAGAAQAARVLVRAGGTGRALVGGLTLLTAFGAGEAELADDDVDGTHAVVVAGDRDVSGFGVAVGVDEADGGDAELAGFLDGGDFVTDVDDDQHAGEPPCCGCRRGCA